MGICIIENTEAFQLLNIYFETYKAGGVCGTYQSLTSEDKNVVRDIRRFGIFGKNNQYILPITSQNWTPFSLGIGAYSRRAIGKTRFPKGFINSAGEDVFFQLAVQKKGYSLFYTSRVRGIHDANVCASQLFKKLLNEVRAVGNIIIYTSDKTLPYCPYFLNYPLLLVISGLLIFLNPLFILLFIASLIIELHPLRKTFDLSYPLRLKLLTTLYLLFITGTQTIYLPYYLIKNRKIIEHKENILGILFSWEKRKYLW